MSGSKIIYTSNVNNIKDKLTKVKELFDDETLDLITRDEEVTEEYLSTLKARYTDLLKEVETEKNNLQKLTPTRDLAEVHKRLSILVQELNDSTLLATNSVKEDTTSVVVRELASGIKQQQYSVDDIEKIANQLIANLTELE